MATGRKTGGRAKGTPNKSTKEIREQLENLFTPEYFTSLPMRLAEGKLAPQIEAKLLAYRFGEPKQQMELSGHVTMPNIVLKEYAGRD